MSKRMRKRLMECSESRRSLRDRSATFAKRSATISQGRRSGVILVVAMICLLLASALVGTLLKMAVAQRRYAKTEAAALQTEWLAESALDRAAAALAEDASYAGETWTVPAEDLDGTHSGRVVIEIVPAKAGNPRELKVIAQYPAEGSQKTKCTKRIRLAGFGPAKKPAGQSPAKAEKPGR